ASARPAPRPAARKAGYDAGPGSRRPGRRSPRIRPGRWVSQQLTPRFIILPPRGAGATLDDVVEIVPQPLQIIGRVLERRADQLRAQMPRLDHAPAVVIGMEPRGEAGGDRLGRA